MRPLDPCCRPWIAAATLVAGLFCAALIAVPMAERSGVAAASLGRVALKPACHQIPDRCLDLGAGPLPVCARCAGLYAGGFAGLLATVIAGRRFRPGWKALALAVAPSVVDSGRLSALRVGRNKGVVMRTFTITLGLLAVIAVVLCAGCEKKEEPAGIPEKPGVPAVDPEKTPEEAAACICEVGKEGGTVWCPKCAVGYIEGEKTECQDCVVASAGGPAKCEAHKE